MYTVNFVNAPYCPSCATLPPNRYDFVAMWDFVKLAPEKLLAISKTLNGASFGFGLSKLLVSASTAGVFAILQLFPDHWGLIGGRNVPLGGSAKGHTDPGAFLENLNRMDNDVMSSFNVDFGPIIKEGNRAVFGNEGNNRRLGSCPTLSVRTTNAIVTE